MFEQTVESVLTSPWFLSAWVVLALAAVAVLVRDLARDNPQTPGLMKWVWGFTVAYSGPIGLAIYFYAGRRQIPRDDLWRRSFRSVAHCYSGCGAGEIVGVVITVGLLSLSNWWVAGVTFTLAYVMGYALTVGPMMQEGVPFRQAMWDALISETASIAVMEIVAIAVDLWLAGNANMGDRIFWASLIVSLTAGLAAAYPVNVLLIRFGVKEGMGNPREAAA
jgi:hypothetical protein